jgi:hypothetical protein
LRESAQWNRHKDRVELIFDIRPESAGLTIAPLVIYFRNDKCEYFSLNYDSESKSVEIHSR